MQNQHQKLLRKLSQSWNQLDVSILETDLDNHVVYESQWVLAPLEGKSKIIHHLKTKFNAIRAEVLKGDMMISAKLATHRQLPNEEIIVLSQTSGANKTQVVIRITVACNKISRIDVCFIPDPALAKVIS